MVKVSKIINEIQNILNIYDATDCDIISFDVTEEAVIIDVFVNRQLEQIQIMH